MLIAANPSSITASSANVSNVALAIHCADPFSISCLMLTDAQTLNIEHAQQPETTCQIAPVDDFVHTHDNAPTHNIFRMLVANFCHTQINFCLQIPKKC